MNSPLDMQTAVAPFAEAELAAARALMQENGSCLCDTLATLGGIPAELGLVRLGASLHLPCMSMAALRMCTPAFDLLPFGEAMQRECLIMRNAEGMLLRVVANPFDIGLLDWLDVRVPHAHSTWIALRSELAAFLASCESAQRAMEGVLSQSEQTDQRHEAEDISLRRISEDSSPVVRLVNSTLHDALKSAASDIHLECTPSGLHIKYRVDGVLVNVGSVQGSDMAEQAISRIKVMAELDIAERRVPQDGRFKVAVQGRDIDIRVSIMPSIFGEDAVLRVLDKRSLSDQMSGLRLDSLGFDAETMALLRRLSAEPYGMLLVTGPTGSGKTTTLYAAISEINNGRDKIVTIEDPVEYQLAGVLQIPVNEKKGLTFARGLRSILRHDPDKIMVGEIRDGETAGIAVQAALTGHLVLTTVHANNVFDVLGRFTHMEVDPFNLVAALNGIVAQRLLRLNCPECSVAVEPDSALLAASRIVDSSGFKFMAGKGCSHCRGTGFKGRKAVAEVLVLDDELRELISNREPTRKIKEAAARSGTRVLRDAGIALVRKGETSLEELNRVVV